MPKPVVAVVIGSDSDLPTLKDAFSTLAEFGVSYVARVISAHRTPDEALVFAVNAESDGIKVIICAAGMAAHLAGVIASRSIIPVIGIPMSCEPFNGLDSLLSTAQMPSGVPVAAVSAGKAGAMNAALLAVQILALSDSALSGKLRVFRKDQAEKVKKTDSELAGKIKKLLTVV